MNGRPELLAPRLDAIPDELRATEQIVRALNLLHGPEGVAEVRILGVEYKGTISGYYDAANFDKAARDIAAWDGKGDGVYITLNPVPRDLLARAANRLKTNAKFTTGDKEITRRRWLFLDADAIRPKGISANEAEHAAALAKGAVIRDFLHAEGWPDPVEADSGNGCHLLHAVDLLNDAASRDLISRVIQALRARFNDATVEVDDKTFNAARICKLYGTVAAKGDDVLGLNRPHRRAALLRVPEQIVPVPLALLEALAGPPPPQAARTNEPGPKTAAPGPKQDKPDAGQHADPFGDVADIPDDELRRRMFAAKNGDAIKRLWHGDDNDFDGDASKGDLALCGYLASWTQKDAGRIERLFDASLRTRPKWSDRPDYRRRTISKAVAECTWVYDPGAELQFSQKKQFRGQNPTPTNSAWEAPVPFGTHNPPPFPVAALGGSLAPFVEALAEATQTPADIAGTLLLPGVATCVQGKAVIEGAPGWEEPLMFYAAAVAEPGTRKSAVVKPISAPLLAHERQEITRLAPLREEAEHKRDLLTKKLEHAKQQAVKGKTSDERLLGEADIQTYLGELAALQVPGEFRLFTEDCSVERLPGLMQENGGRMAVLSAEGDVLAIMAGRYSDRGPNLLIFKKGHTGETFQSDRVGRKGEYIPEPALTLGVAFQPSVLRDLFKVPALRGEGLLARFLYTVPPSRVGYRKINAAPVPAPVAADYAAVIGRLLALPYPAEGETPPVIGLSEPAAALFHDYQVATEVSLRPGGNLSGFADWGGKLCGEVLRVAALLHLSRGYGYAHPVPVDTMRDAIEVGDYFIEHARAAFAEMGGDKATDDARTVIAWLVTRGEKPEGVRVREADVWRNFHDRFKEKEALSACLETLCARHYLRRAQEEAKEGAGRRPSPAYDVNPSLFKGGEPPTKLNKSPKLPESAENGDEDDFAEVEA